MLKLNPCQQMLVSIFMIAKAALRFFARIKAIAVSFVRSEVWLVLRCRKRAPRGNHLAVLETGEDAMTEMVQFPATCQVFG